jgi:hypothetical protein
MPECKDNLEDYSSPFPEQNAWKRKQLLDFKITFYLVTTGGLMEQHTFENLNNCLNINMYSYLETSGGQSSNPYLNVVHFLNTRAD